MILLPKRSVEMYSKPNSFILITLVSVDILIPRVNCVNLNKNMLLVLVNLLLAKICVEAMKVKLNKIKMNDF